MRQTVRSNTGKLSNLATPELVAIAKADDLPMQARWFALVCLPVLVTSLDELAHLSPQELPFPVSFGEAGAAPTVRGTSALQISAQRGVARVR